MRDDSAGVFWDGGVKLGQRCRRLYPPLPNHHPLSNRHVSSELAAFYSPQPNIADALMALPFSLLLAPCWLPFFFSLLRCTIFAARTEPSRAEPCHDGLGCGGGVGGVGWQLLHLVSVWFRNGNGLSPPTPHPVITGL